MKLIRKDTIEVINNWVKRFAIYECPRCQQHFRANIDDINRKRKRNCGCMIEREDLPAEINGVKVIRDLGIVKGDRHALISCVTCGVDMQAMVCHLKSGRLKPICKSCPKPKRATRPKQPKPPKINKPRVPPPSVWLSDEFKHMGHTGHNKDHTLYTTWMGIRKRCYNVNNDNYKNYGGRGIKMCDRWLNSFPYFVMDMGNKPTPAHTIDRVDCDGMYEPTNCRWATPKEQANNKRKL